MLALATGTALAAPANAPAAVIRPPVTIDEAQRARGIVRTSVDYGDRNGLGGEAGFICGRQDIAVKDGAAGAGTSTTRSAPPRPRASVRSCAASPSSSPGATHATA